MRLFAAESSASSLKRNMYLKICFSFITVCHLFAVLTVSRSIETADASANGRGIDGTTIQGTVHESMSRLMHDSKSSDYPPLGGLPFLDEDLQLIKTKDFTKMATNYHNQEMLFRETGSGDDMTEIPDEKGQTDQKDRKTLTPNANHETFNTPSTVGPDIYEGSGDRYGATDTTTEFVSQFTEVTTNVSITNHTLDDLPSSCLSVPCNGTALQLPNEATLVIPEDTNFTISCQSYVTENASIYWYHDGNDNRSSIRNSSHNNVLSLVFTKTKLSESGIYSCILHLELSCCHTDILLQVYSSPNYKLHLMVLGIVGIICLLTCVLLCLWQKHRFVKYSRQFPSTKHNKDQLLLNEITTQETSLKNGSR